MKPGNTVVIGVATFCALWLATWAFALPIWIALSTTVVTAGLYAQRMGPGPNLIITSAHFGSCVSVLAFGFMQWVPTVTTIVALALIVKRFWGF